MWERVLDFWPVNVLRIKQYEPRLVVSGIVFPRFGSVSSYSFTEWCRQHLYIITLCPRGTHSVKITQFSNRFRRFLRCTDDAHVSFVFDYVTVFDKSLVPLKKQTDRNTTSVFRTRLPRQANTFRSKFSEFRGKF